MKTILAILCFSFLNFACWQSNLSGKKTKISIYNNSKKAIDSVRIASYGVSKTYVNLLPNNRQEQVLDVNNKNYEGAFTILIFNNDSLMKSSTFGYFAKIEDIEDKYAIEINDDFVIKEMP
jgi:hypothetical protein